MNINFIPDIVTVFKDVYKSIDNGKTWTTANSNPPFTVRQDPVVVTFTTSIFLIGGYDWTSIYIYIHSAYI